MKPIRACILSSALLALASAAHAFNLTVEVLNARSAQGTVGGALYTEANWMKDPVQRDRQPAAAKTILSFHDLPVGRYALSVFHDENGNGKLDTNLVGMPVEPYGFSRDARGRMGPPGFADAAFDLDADTTITVTLH